MAKKLNINQRAALSDLLKTGELKRTLPHENFEGEKIHNSKTIHSLINLGMAEVTKKSPYNWPLIVRPTELAVNQLIDY
jgi:hypothetical protein